MTSITIWYNKLWLAIASDSAWSANWKIFPSNKIFRISENLPIWLATYQNLEIWWVPTELISKLFRTTCCDSFKDLEELMSKFIDFLENEDQIQRKDQEIIEDHICEIIDKINSTIEDYNTSSQQSKNLPHEKLIEIAVKKIEDKWNSYAWDPEMKYFDEAHVDDIMKVYDSLNEEDILQWKNELMNYKSEWMKDLLRLSFCYRIVPYTTGLIFFGYWTSNLFPTFLNIELLVKFRKKMYFKHTDKKTNESIRGIESFADYECTNTIIYWISDQLKDVVSSISWYQELTDLSWNNIIEEAVESNKGKILNSIEHLSLPELAVMAETFVNAESFKKRMTSESESVWWPIDVAVASKVDWFIWIKRKHYFDSEINPHFINNYK